MPNRAYASLWLRDFSEDNMLAQFERFLATVPVTAQAPAFTDLVVHAVDWTETPVEEQDLRPQALTPAEIIELAREHHGSDICFEVGARWDLWMRDMELAKWNKQPVPLSLYCFGPDFDHGVYGEQGHFMADLGFEHVFTGHANLLTSGPDQAARPEHPDEARFLMWMSRSENFREYQEKTRENIQKLMEWVRLAEAALPVERTRLWSEGEANFEARLDEILAVP
jgi:hypothetical protein